MSSNMHYNGKLKVYPPVSDTLMDRINEIQDKEHKNEGYGRRYCNWYMPDNTTIMHNGSDGSSEDAEWLDFIMTRFLANHDCNGEIRMMESGYDYTGLIRVLNKQVYQLDEVSDYVKMPSTPTKKMLNAISTCNHVPPRISAELTDYMLTDIWRQMHYAYILEKSELKKWDK